MPSTGLGTVCSEPFRAGLAALPSVPRWLNLVSCIRTAAFVPVPDSLGGPEPHHSPLLLQSSCAILATITDFKNSKPQISGHRLLFIYLFINFVAFCRSFRSLSPPAPGLPSKASEQMLELLFPVLLAARAGESLPLALLASTAALQPAPARVGAHCCVLCELVLLNLI